MKLYYHRLRFYAILEIKYYLFPGGTKPGYCASNIIEVILRDQQREGGFMKKIFAAMMCLMLIFTLSIPTMAYSYDNDSYPLYRVWTVVADNQLYMYRVASSSGEPLCAYKKGTLLRVVNWYVYDSSTYCYAVGPDGRDGYVRKSCLLKYYDYDDASLACYSVNSTHYESGAYRLYMYPTPSSSTDPVNVAGYVNGTILKVVDWNVDTSYCYAVAPDGHCGFVRKAWLTLSSGKQPTQTLPATEYYWPGMAKNQGSSSSSSSGMSTPFLDASTLTMFSNSFLSGLLK